jgi:hypothetical protein
MLGDDLGSFHKLSFQDMLQQPYLSLIMKINHLANSVIKLLSNEG